MTVNVSLLSKICEIPGAPGFEKPIRDFLKKELEGIGAEQWTDNMGSFYVRFTGKGPEPKKLVLTAHMDEIAFIVTHVDDKGFVRFHPLGGFDPKTLSAQRVIIHGKEDVLGVMGTKPIHVMSAEERNKKVKITDFFIDTGLSKEELEGKVAVGDSITRERSLVEMGHTVNCKSIDNRACVYALVEILRAVKDPEVELVGVFTVQEEVGLRGAQVAAHLTNPDFAINLDTTVAFDLPGAQSHEMITKLGEGVAVKVMDSSTICDVRMVAFLRACAEAKGIKWQSEVLTAGGTDTGSLQRMGKQGAIAGALSLPTRHLHQVIEMAHKEDIAAMVELATAAIEEISKHDWEA